ncbi:hypothetical protein [Cytobacillus citreus]|uniref:hypothetical protein n=1 Tax=Cytobacillus citreus TaxID=2833586 RepID=UPI002016E453|nr:hypothetical protein [Cytobacillus citreus]
MFITAAAVGAFTFGFGAWIPGIIFSFVYNRIYIKDLLEKGYLPADEQTKMELSNRGIISAVKSAV